MTRAKELAGLIERVEKATGPDGAIDDLLYWTLKQHPAKGPFARIPAYTASIDAAVALVERLLPGIFWVIGQGKTNSVEKLFGCQLLFGTEEIIGSGESDHAPLAILLALLKALQESQDAQ